MKSAGIQRLVFAAALGITLLGCGLLELPWSMSGESPLMAIEYTGGLCPYGSCYNRSSIYSSGRFLNEDGAGVKETGDLGRARADELRTLIESSDFNALTAVKFTGECPTAHGWQEITYTFYRRGETERISNCQYVIDFSTPLFRKVNELLPWIGTPTPQFIRTAMPMPTMTPTRPACKTQPDAAIQSSAARIRVAETVTLTFTIVDVGMPDIYFSLSSGAGARLKWSEQYAHPEIKDDNMFEILAANGRQVILRGKAPGKAAATIQASGEMGCFDRGYYWGITISEAMPLEVIP